MSDIEDYMSTDDDYDDNDVDNDAEYYDDAYWDKFKQKPSIPITWDVGKQVSNMVSLKNKQTTQTVVDKPEPIKKETKMWEKIPKPSLVQVLTKLDTFNLTFQTTKKPRHCKYKKCFKVHQKPNGIYINKPYKQICKFLHACETIQNYNKRVV